MRNREHPNANHLRGPCTLLLVGTLGLASSGSAPAEIFETPLAPQPPRTRAQVGWSVALDEATAALGAPVEAGDGTVHLFERDGIDWSELSIPSFPGAEGDLIGFAVALQGGCLIVGAPGVDGDRGAAYLLGRNGGAWSIRSTVQASGGSAGDRFGEAVALDGNTAAVAAPGAEMGKGAVYLFALQGSPCGGPTQSARLTASARDDGDSFGRAVALRGGTLVVGAPFDREGGSDSGSAFFFERGPAGWPPTAPPRRSGELFDAFAFSAAISPNGQTVAVGSLGSGSVIVFERAGNQWRELPPVSAGGDPVASQFGVSVALSNDRLAVGARRAQGSTGAAFLFHRQNGVWSQLRRLEPAVLDPGAQFGISVAVSSQNALVGAFLSDRSGVLDTGTAFVFENQTASLRLVSTSSRIGEAAGTAVCQVQLETSDGLPTRADVSVQASTKSVPGGALPNRDFDPSMKTLEWNRGSAHLETRAISIVIRNDELDEADEALVVSLADPENATLSGSVDHEVTIEDDDTAGILLNGSTEPISLETNEDGTSDSFEVVLTSRPTAEVIVRIASSDETEGRVEPARLRFGPGNWDQAQTVELVGEDDSESDCAQEYEVRIDVESGDRKYDGFEIGPVAAVNGDDEVCDAVVISFAESLISAKENSFSAEVAIEVRTIDGEPLEAKASIFVATEAATAETPEDFIEIRERLSFPAGTGSGIRQTIEIPIVNDCFIENEAFKVVLSEPRGATLSGALAEVDIVIKDDDRFFIDESEWRAAVGDFERFDTTAENISLAEEVSSIPGEGAVLDSQLTFLPRHTKLSRTFTVETLQSGAKLVFNDVGDSGTVVEDALSIGKSGVHEFDNFVIRFEGPDLRGFGLYILESSFFPSEPFQVFSGNQLIGSLPGDQISGGTTAEISSFVGAVSSCPITRIRNFEGSLDDDIHIANFRFSRPSAIEIPTLSRNGIAVLTLLISGLAFAFLRRLRR